MADNNYGHYLNLITCTGDWIPAQHQTTMRLSERRLINFCTPSVQKSERTRSFFADGVYSREILYSLNKRGVPPCVDITAYLLVSYALSQPVLPLPVRSHLSHLRLSLTCQHRVFQGFISHLAFRSVCMPEA